MIRPFKSFNYRLMYETLGVLNIFDMFHEAF